MPQRPGEHSRSKLAGKFQRNRPPQLVVERVDDDDAMDERLERREFVAELRRQGKSLRTIARQLGVSHEQVRQDLAANLTGGVDSVSEELVLDAVLGPGCCWPGIGCHGEEQVRAAWREDRELIMSRNGLPGTRPCAWWRFELGEPMPRRAPGIPGAAAARAGSAARAGRGAGHPTGDELARGRVLAAPVDGA